MTAVLSPPVACCKACDTPKKLRHYLARYAGKPVPEIVELCAECAVLARAHWYDSIVSLAGPFPSLGVAESEIGRLDRIRTHIAAAMGFASNGDFAGMRQALFSALTLVEARREIAELIEEIGAQGNASPFADGRKGLHGQQSYVDQVAHDLGSPSSVRSFGPVGQ